MNRFACYVLGGVVLIVSGSSVAAFAQPAASTRTDVESRYQIGQMERVLEGAVEHGVRPAQAGDGELAAGHPAGLSAGVEVGRDRRARGKGEPQQQQGVAGRIRRGRGLRQLLRIG